MSSTRLFGLIERYALLMLGVVIFLFFAFNAATPQFATEVNLRNVLRNQSILGILVIATLIPIVAGKIDLSVGPNAGLCAMVFAGMMSRLQMDLGYAILVALVVGLLVGAVNGLLVAGLGIDSIVVTLGTLSIIAAVVNWYSGGLSIVTNLSPYLPDIGRAEWLGFARPFWVFLLLAVVAYYVLQHTPIGRYVYSAGSNPKAAELVGLRVRRYTVASFVISGGLAAIAGVLMVAMQGGANPQLGPAYMLPALAAVFLGTTAITPGRPNVPGSVLAVFFIAISVNGLTLLGSAVWVNPLFNGVALLVGVGASVYSGKRRRMGKATRSLLPTRGPEGATPADPERVPEATSSAPST